MKSQFKKSKQLYTIEQLRAEQYRVEEALEREREKIGESYTQLKESLTFVNLLRQAVTRISILIPLLTTLKSLYSFISNHLFKGKAETIDPKERKESSIEEVELKEEERSDEEKEIIIS